MLVVFIIVPFEGMASTTLATAARLQMKLKPGIKTPITKINEK